MKVIVNTSTFKKNDSDKITDVINELVRSISKNNQTIEFTILKPMGTNGNKTFINENIKRLLL